MILEVYKRRRREIIIKMNREEYDTARKFCAQHGQRLVIEERRPNRYYVRMSYPLWEAFQRSLANESSRNSS